MSIRTNTNPHSLELHPELQEILMRNGMRATVTGSSDGFRLVVQGHDSPLLYYPISEKQLRALVDWGTNSANKRAYNTLASIIAADFDLPRDFVHARNANGRVAMGLHGNRIGVGEYGRTGYEHMMHRHPFGHGFLGWTPRNQEGYHMRRIGGNLWYPAGAPMMAVRPDGRIKPGELSTGGYGFYYKGAPQGAIQGTVPGQDVLAQMQTIIQPIPTVQRSTDPAVPYKEAITSNVYFTNEKWQEVLSSHGILLNAEKKTLTVQSTAVQTDMIYNLSEEDVKKLTDNSLKSTSLTERLKVINNVIKDDFSGAVTMEMLNSKEKFNLDLKPELRRDMESQQQAVETLIEQSQGKNMVSQEEQFRLDLLREGRPDIGAAIDGRELYEQDPDKAWFREGSEGREVLVERISVQPREDPQGKESKYTMTAVINGETITHDITQKQYDKFLAVNDMQRMKMFSKIFSEVDMKSVERGDVGEKIGAGLLTALTVGGVVLGAALSGGRSHSRPEFYGSGCSAPRPYYKPGVDSPEDVAARNYDAIINNPRHDSHRGLGF